MYPIVDVGMRKIPSFKLAAHQQICHSNKQNPPASAPVHRQKVQLDRNVDIRSNTAAAAAEASHSYSTQNGTKGQGTRNRSRNSHESTLIPVPPSVPRPQRIRQPSTRTSQKYEGEQFEEITEDFNQMQLKNHVPKVHKTPVRQVHSSQIDEYPEHDDFNTAPLQDFGDIPETLDLTGQLEQCPICERKFMADRLVLNSLSRNGIWSHALQHPRLVKYLMSRNHGSKGQSWRNMLRNPLSIKYCTFNS